MKAVLHNVLRLYVKSPLSLGALQAVRVEVVSHWSATGIGATGLT
jgi:hypothetical protein